jgi:hypothetical protein
MDESVKRQFPVCKSLDTVISAANVGGALLAEIYRVWGFESSASVHP